MVAKARKTGTTPGKSPGTLKTLDRTAKPGRGAPITRAWQQNLWRAAKEGRIESFLRNVVDGKAGPLTQALIDKIKPTRVDMTAAEVRWFVAFWGWTHAYRKLEARYEVLEIAVEILRKGGFPPAN